MVLEEIMGYCMITYVAVDVAKDAPCVGTSCRIDYKLIEVVLVKANVKVGFEPPLCRNIVVRTRTTLIILKRCLKGES